MDNNILPKEYIELKALVMKELDKVEGDKTGLSKFIVGMFDAIETVYKIDVGNQYVEYIKEHTASIIMGLLHVSLLSPMLFSMCEKGMHNVLYTNLGINSVDNINKGKLH